MKQSSPRLSSSCQPWQRMLKPPGPRKPGLCRPRRRPTARGTPRSGALSLELSLEKNLRTTLALSLEMHQRTSLRLPSAAITSSARSKTLSRWLASSTLRCSGSSTWSAPAGGCTRSIRLRSEGRRQGARQVQRRHAGAARTHPGKESD